MVSVFKSSRRIGAWSRLPRHLGRKLNRVAVRCCRTFFQDMFAASPPTISRGQRERLWEWRRARGWRGWRWRRRERRDQEGQHRDFQFWPNVRIQQRSHGTKDGRMDGDFQFSLFKALRFFLYIYIWLKSYSFLNIAKQQMHSIAFLWFALICWCCSLPYPGGTAVGVSHSRGHDLESSALARRMWPISHQLDRQIPGRKPLNDAKCTSNSGGTSGSFDKLRTFHSLVGTLTAFAANFQMQSWCQEVLAGFQL